MGGGISVITAAIGIAFVLRISYALEDFVKTSKCGSVIMTVSSASYIIYLLHTTFEGFMKALVFKLPYLSDLNNDMMFTLGAIMVVLAGVVSPILLYMYVLRKYEITKIAFGLK